jgi:NADPH-dependent 2,4-dienoyl-CoA reductase/sulfur reductase-like enzyme
MRYVIIGASAAGCRAAETLRRYAPESHITVVSEEVRPLYSRPLLTYLLSGEVSPDQVWLQGEDWFSRWNLTPVLGEPVVRVDPKAREVRLASGSVLSYDRLLVASGARPRLPGIPGEDLPGCFTLRTLADWQRLERDLPPEGPVAVVGAGAVGLKAAEALVHRGHKVVLLEAESRALPRMLDEAAAALLHRALARLQVELRLDSRPLAVLEEKRRVRALALAEGREIPAAAVLFATGVLPNVDFLKDTGLVGEDGLTVDSHLRTADPHIYAAGDCTRAPHFLTGKPAYYPIWPGAVAQGGVAGANLAGAGLNYGGVLPQNSVSLSGFHLITGGLSPLEAGEGCEVVTEGDPHRGQWRQLVYRQGRLVGLTFVGAVEDAGLHFQLMAQQLPMSAPVTPGRLWG